MLYEKVAITAYAASFALLAYALSRHKTFEAWLFGLLVVIGLLIGYKVAQLTGASAGAYGQIVDLAMSAASTCLLAQSGFALMGQNGYRLKLALLLNYAGQAYGVIKGAPADQFNVFAVLDVTACMLAGGIFGIALSKKFGDPLLAGLALAFPLLWGFSDLFYWVHESLPIVGKYACKVAMTAGACGTAVMAVVLALREEKSNRLPPSSPLAPAVT